LPRLARLYFGVIAGGLPVIVPDGPMLVDVSQEVTCPNAVLRSDAGELIGLLAVLEGAIWGNELPREFVDKMRARFIREGHLTQDAGDYELRQAVNDVNQQLRYALGEYDEPPGGVREPV
jgi:hypothetical protein